VNEARVPLLVICMLLPLHAGAEQAAEAGPEVKLTNALRLNYASSDKWLSDETHYVLATFESKAVVAISPMVRGAFQVRAGTVSGPLGRSSVRFPFAYLDVKTPAVDFRIGKQILAWGRTDALNPTDVVTPRDYTTMLPFDEDERAGLWGVRSNVYLSDAVVASVFLGVRSRPSTLPFVSRDAERYQFDTAGARRRQIGVRVSTSTGDMDFSVSAYRGASLLGQAMRIDTVPGQPDVTVLGYPLIDMLGADFAKNFGKYGVRIEGASIRPHNHAALSTLGMQPYRYLVAGADRTFLSELNVNLQLFARWADNGALPQNSAPRVEALNNLIFVQTRKHTYGMTMRIANQWSNQTLGAELFVQHYIGDNSTYLHPLVTYAISDQVKIAAGAVWYHGKEGTLFGVMKRNNAIFSELRYSF
jgi:hypothetical protein